MSNGDIDNPWTTSWRFARFLLTIFVSFYFSASYVRMHEDQNKDQKLPDENKKKPFISL